MVERIRKRCAEIGTTMGTLEKELGFANGSIRRWDERVPGIDRVLILANRLEVSIEWLVTGKEPGELTPEEQKLIDTFRSCSRIGQSIIQEQAEAIRQKLPAEQTDQPAESSTSAIG